MSFLKKNLNYILIVFLNSINILLRLPDFNRPFWSDELISLRTININPLINPLYEGVSTNLPLYYYFLKIFSALFYGENLRYTSLFFSIIILNIFLYRFLKEENSVNLIAAFLITISPIQIYYSNELRTYMLTELLLILQFFFLKDFIQGKKVNYFLWGFVIFLSLVSHYTSYIFVGVSIVYLVIKERKFSEALLKSYIFPIIFGFLILISISGNSGFTDSTEKSIINGNYSRINLQNLQENTLRLVEVLTIYYNFGLHYYRLDSLFTSFFKKFMYFFILIPLFWVFIKNKFKNFELNMSALMLLMCLLVAILFDMLGFIIFAGRYIFPFHFLYLLTISHILLEVYKKSKWGFSILLLVFIISYNLYNTCLYLRLDLYRGNNDPQGSIIQNCFK